MPAAPSLIVSLPKGLLMGYRIRLAKSAEEDRELIRIIGNGIYGIPMDRLRQCKSANDLAAMGLRMATRPPETCVIVEAPDGSIAGGTRVTIDPQRSKTASGEQVYWSSTGLLPEHRGKRLSLPSRVYALEKTNADVVRSRVKPSNKRSWAVAEKLGYHQVDFDAVSGERIYELRPMSSKVSKTAELVDWGHIELEPRLPKLAGDAFAGMTNDQVLQQMYGDDPALLKSMQNPSGAPAAQRVVPPPQPPQPMMTDSTVVAPRTTDEIDRINTERARLLSAGGQTAARAANSYRQHNVAPFAGGAPQAPVPPTMQPPTQTPPTMGQTGPMLAQATTVNEQPQAAPQSSVPVQQPAVQQPPQAQPQVQPPAQPRVPTNAPMSTPQASLSSSAPRPLSNYLPGGQPVYRGPQGVAGLAARAASEGRTKTSNFDNPLQVEDPPRPNGLPPGGKIRQVLPGRRDVSHETTSDGDPTQGTLLGKVAVGSISRGLRALRKVAAETEEELGHSDTFKVTMPSKDAAQFFCQEMSKVAGAVVSAPERTLRGYLVEVEGPHEKAAEVAREVWQAHAALCRQRFQAPKVASDLAGFLARHPEYTVYAFA